MLHPTYDDLLTDAVAEDHPGLIDDLNDLEERLVADGTLTRLTLRTDKRTWNRYFRDLAAEYINRYGNPTERTEQ